MGNLKKLNILSLTLLITGAIDSIRNLPPSALFGSALIFFFIFSAITFLLPTALISAELSANVDEGGIYQWGRLAFGDRVGFLAIWLQWINNVVWFPTILSFIAGTSAYLIDPALAQNKFFLVSTILAVFWILTLINFKGIRLSAKFTSFCAITGLIIPMATIIILFLFWLILGKPIQIHFTPETMLPNFQHADNWISLTAIMLGFAGMELATVHIKDVDNPQKTFPKALAISTVIILVTMMLGSLAIACVLPYKQINLVNGTVETFSYFLTAYHLSWLTPVLTILLVIGSLGGVVSWVVSPVRGLTQAAEHGFLPEFFQKKNKNGISQNILLVQAILVSLVCLAFLFLPSINASYWLLSALSTQLYMVMYVLMFICALRLRHNANASKPNAFCIPGKKVGLWSVCLLGLIGCLITIMVGFIPPDNLNIGSNFYYEMVFCGGMIAMMLPSLYFYRHHAKKTQNAAAALLELEKKVV